MFGMDKFGSKVDRNHTKRRLAGLEANFLAFRVKTNLLTGSSVRLL